LLDVLAVDLRNALRIFRRSPGFAATAVVSLAVGIAAATGLFSIVNAALLNPFPFADTNRIVRLDMIDKGKPRGLVSRRDSSSPFNTAKSSTAPSPGTPGR
jgi:hypothetical protein